MKPPYIYFADIDEDDEDGNEEHPTFCVFRERLFLIWVVRLSVQMVGVFAVKSPRT